MVNPVDVKPSSTSVEKEKSKCNFCNRCETCQANIDKDKAKGKDKKEIEAKCQILNYFVLCCIFLLIFTSNMVLWLIMAS